MEKWQYLLLAALAASFFGGIAWILGGKGWGTGIGLGIFTLFLLTPPPE